jgi:cytochrome b6-f complex iron-sulfur subunit
MRSARTFINDLLAGRRPRSFRARPKDVEALRTAIALRAARGDDAPGEDFVAGLRQRLAEQQQAPAQQRTPGQQRTPEPLRSAPSGDKSRRRFVQATSAAAGVAAVAGVGIDQLWMRNENSDKPAIDVAGGTLKPNAGVWTPVVSSADLPENGIHRFDVGTMIGFVQRRKGKLRAVSGICTHQGCKLNLDAAVSELKCPCHRSVFALTGEVVRSQLKQPPRTLPEILVREANGVVEIFAPQE